MLNKFSKTLLFLLAYLPLIITVIIKNSFNFTSIVSVIIFSIILLILIRYLLKTVEQIVPSQEDVEINELKNSEYLTFIITYIVPFFGFEFNYQTTLASILLFIIIGCIYIESSLFCINPLLKIIFRYNLYDITYDDKKGYLLSRNDLKLKNQKIKIKNLSYNVYMED